MPADVADESALPYTVLARTLDDVPSFFTPYTAPCTLSLHLLSSSYTLYALHIHYILRNA
eukprot:5716018-Prymnesium_polylepis.3